MTGQASRFENAIKEFRQACPLPHRIEKDMNEIDNIFEAFLAMKQAYEKFMREAEAFVEERRERQMNLPPTLGQENK